ncbi:hypothetical protein JOC77_001260 [Peribacillus deserti]|uniref:Uncharacterized protein n=1 Tax=Peribacillus deserti TaxID=673318 RepID=A0ABS2QFB9_9BACI|nr:hypothetical protein [Peribacillus deserti]
MMIQMLFLTIFIKQKPKSRKQDRAPGTDSAMA